MGLSRKICAPASASAPRSDKKAMRRASGDQRGVSSRFGCDVRRMACRNSSTSQMSELKRSFSRSHELTTNATRRASGDIWASLARLSETTSSGVIGRFACAEAATTRISEIKETGKILRIFFCLPLYKLEAYEGYHVFALLVMFKIARNRIHRPGGLK